MMMTMGTMIIISMIMMIMILKMRMRGKRRGRSRNRIRRGMRGEEVDIVETDDYSSLTVFPPIDFQLIVPPRKWSATVLVTMTVTIASRMRVLKMNIRIAQLVLSLSVCIDC